MTVTAMLLAAVRQLPGVWRTWQQRSQTRARLDRLTPLQLRDIGLDPDAVARELHKPFWQPLGTMLGEPFDDARAAALRGTAARRSTVPRALRPAATFSAVLLPWRS